VYAVPTCRPVGPFAMHTLYFRLLALLGLSRGEIISPDNRLTSSFFYDRDRPSLSEGNTSVL